METLKTKLKYILYCRKSTDSEDRQIASLDDQREELEDVERIEKLTVVEKFGGDENGERRTAHKRGRPIFNYAMNQIEAGKANALLVWHANRLSRNAFDGGWIVTAMDEGKLLEVKTPRRVFRNTAEDKYSLLNEFSVAKKTSDDTSEAIRRRLKRKLEDDGIFPGGFPVGWVSTKRTDVQNAIVADPERIAKVTQVLLWLESGAYTPKQVMQKGNKELKLTFPATKKRPERPVSRNGYYRLFSNPFVCGWREYPKGSGKWRKGTHTPAITEEQFDRIQVILGRKGKPRPRKHRFTFAGLMSCGYCGASIIGEEHTKRQMNGNVHHYIYYRCTKKLDPMCPEKYIEAKKLKKQIDDILADISISEDFQNYGIQYYNLCRRVEARTHINALETKQRALVEVNKQLSNLMLKFTSPENTEGQFFTDQEYKDQKAQLLKQKTSLEKDLNKQGTGVEKWLEKSEQTFQFARSARYWFSKGNWEVKRRILTDLGSNLVLKDQKVALTLHKPYKSISNSLYQAEAEILAVRTSKNGFNKRHLGEVLARCPISRCIWDDVRTFFQYENPDLFIPLFKEDDSGQFKLAA